MITLDFSFLTWSVITNLVLKGLVFSVQLTLIAMLGGRFVIEMKEAPAAQDGASRFSVASGLT